VLIPPQSSVFSAFCLLLGAASPAPPRPVIVAAENVYGQVAAEIAGGNAEIISVLNNPAQDPHVFEPAPSVARAVAHASITIADGAGYDPWMARLVAASPSATRQDIVAAELVQAAPGANPHLWYQPRAVMLTATRITSTLVARDPAHAAAYIGHMTTLQREIGGVLGAVAALHASRGGMKIAITEPVFTPMAEAIGLDVQEKTFAQSVMNGTEPRASDVAGFEADLRGHKVAAVVYNAQVTSPAVERLLGIARVAHVPVVAVTELMPPGATYAGWMRQQLDGLAAALPIPVK